MAVVAKSAWITVEFHRPLERHIQSYFIIIDKYCQGLVNVTSTNQVLLDVNHFFTTCTQMCLTHTLVCCVCYCGPPFFFSPCRQTNFSRAVPKWATTQLCVKQAYQRSNIVILYDTFQDKGVIAVLFWTSSFWTSCMFVFLFTCFVLYKHHRVSLDMNSDSQFKWGQRLCNWYSICIQSMYKYNIWLMTAPTISNILRATQRIE